MAEGIIMKALSGFYYVDDGEKLVTCRGRGKLRHEKVTPLVGDRVRFTPTENDEENLFMVGKSRGFLLRGGEVDIERASMAVIDDFRKGRLGRITLDKVEL
jgi:ribosome biogenesis GTPase A